MNAYLLEVVVAMILGAVVGTSISALKRKLGNVDVFIRAICLFSCFVVLTGCMLLIWVWVFE